ncbi:MAG TPA: hypothetical protein VMY36_00675 [Patescibacteria group bacterium]|nr:hypothetical protein [Patescibacteria group bacterium]
MSVKNLKLKDRYRILKREMRDEKQEQNIVVVFYSVLFLLVAFLTFMANYPECLQESSFLGGMLVGLVTPTGFLVCNIALFLRGKVSDPFLILIVGIIIIALGPIFGIGLPLLFQSKMSLIGYIFTLSLGVGIIEMARGSYSLYQLSQDDPHKCKED